MSTLPSQVSNKLNGAGKSIERTGKNLVSDAANSIEEFSHNVGERAGQIVSRVSDSVTDYYDSGREYVKENPMKGVAIAAAAGVVTGSLLTLAFRKK